MELLVSNIGFVLSAIGGVLVAVSFGKFPKEFGGSTTGTNGKTYNITYLVRPFFFRLGLIFMILGFLAQVLYPSYLWLKNKEQVGLSSRCYYYIKYDPSVKAWYWQVPILDGYFPTQEAAMKNCQAILSE